jgi:hypothetical protein
MAISFFIEIVMEAGMVPVPRGLEKYIRLFDANKKCVPSRRMFVGEKWVDIADSGDNLDYHLQDPKAGRLVLRGMPWYLPPGESAWASNVVLASASAYQMPPKCLEVVRRYDVGAQNQIYRLWREVIARWRDSSLKAWIPGDGYFRLSPVIAGVPPSEHGLVEVGFFPGEDPNVEVEVVLCYHQINRRVRARMEPTGELRFNSPNLAGEDGRRFRRFISHLVVNALHDVACEERIVGLAETAASSNGSGKAGDRKGRRQVSPLKTRRLPEGHRVRRASEIRAERNHMKIPTGMTVYGTPSQEDDKAMLAAEKSGAHIEPLEPLIVTVRVD